MFRFVCLAVLFFSIGCGGNTGGTKPGVPSGASASIAEVRDLIIDSSTMGIMIKNPADLEQYKEKFPQAVEAISSKSVTYVWGKGLREGVSPEQASVIAFEKSEGERAWAVKDNGEILQVPTSELPNVK